MKIANIDRNEGEQVKEESKNENVQQAVLEKLTPEKARKRRSEKMSDCYKNDVDGRSGSLVLLKMQCKTPKKVNRVWKVVTPKREAPNPLMAFATTILEHSASPKDVLHQKFQLAPDQNSEFTTSTPKVQKHALIWNRPADPDRKAPGVERIMKMIHEYFKPSQMGVTEEEKARRFEEVKKEMGKLNEKEGELLANAMRSVNDVGVKAGWVKKGEVEDGEPVNGLRKSEEQRGGVGNELVKVKSADSDVKPVESPPISRQLTKRYIPTPGASLLKSGLTISQMASLGPELMTKLTKYYEMAEESADPLYTAINLLSNQLDPSRPDTAHMLFGLRLIANGKNVRFLQLTADEWVLVFNLYVGNYAKTMENIDDSITNRVEIVPIAGNKGFQQYEIREKEASGKNRRKISKPVRKATNSMGMDMEYKVVPSGTYDYEFRKP